MRKLARKIIDTVQNTMLDKLLLQSFPMAWLVSMWPRVTGADLASSMPLDVIGLVVLLFAAGLILGWIAEDRPRPKRLSAYDHAHPSSPDAFAGWADRPNDQLRPPGFMRKLVMTLSAGDSPEWMRLLGLLVLLSCFALSLALAYQPAAFWSGVHPWLGEQASRELVFLGTCGVIGVGVVRLWATSQRLRLAPETRTARRLSPVSEALVFGGLVAFVAGMIAIILHLSAVYFLVGGAIIIAVTLITPMRTILSDLRFGKANPPAANDVDQ